MFSCVVLVLALANCAAFNRKNTPLVALVEERLVPEKMPAKVLTAPLYIPVGMVGGILDVFLVHPVMEMPRAWDDMVDLFWTGDAGYVTAMGSLPVRTALSPVWFTLDVFVRSALDFNRNEPPAPPDSGETLDQLAAEGDAAKIELYLQTHEIKVTDNTALRKICEMKTGPDLHATVLNHLGSELLFAQNEQYLIARLGVLPEDDPVIANSFLNAKSLKGGRAVLNRLATGTVPQATASELVSILLRFEDPALTRAILSRIQTGREQ